ncbi:MAG: hypothetical protein LBQ79_02040 [Deltaproteobacteria bacterium]|jgi:Leucine-rich repeat (LRR) protein|nr:hypothetical protein [Deltaproteobacteria bacterium]
MIGNQVPGRVKSGNDPFSSPISSPSQEPEETEVHRMQENRIFNTLFQYVIFAMSFLFLLGFPPEACGSDYSAADQNKLIEIGNASDPGRNLDWSESIPPEQWTGVGWKEHSGTLRVSALHVEGKELTGTLSLNDLDRLSVLDADDNQLAVLDVSGNTVLENLSADRNQLAVLDVSRNTAIKSLSADYNKLTVIDVSRNTALVSLSAGDNQLTVLDVSRNTALETLQIYSNPLTELDVSLNTALKSLSADYNKLTVIDVSRNVSLERLSAGNNKLTALDVSRNTDLRSLDVGNNQLTALDVSLNVSLERLSADNNKLTALDVSRNKALEVLYVYNNQLTALDVSRNTSLEILSAEGNQLTVFDPNLNVALKRLSVERNQLSSIEISRNVALEDLNAGSNQLTVLDVSRNKELKLLSLSNNQLKVLDVSRNTSLRLLAAIYNQLKVLDVSRNVSLVGLWVNNNQLEVLDVSRNAALESLSVGDNKLSVLDVSRNIALDDLDINRNSLTVLDVGLNTALKRLTADGNRLAVLDVGRNTNLEWLSVDRNKLAVLDVGRNTALKWLSVEDNRLEVLDVGQNIALENLEVSGNRLSVLDVSRNVALENLEANGNLLADLDLSHNSSLEGLVVSSNRLTDLDVSNNKSLKWLDVSGNRIPLSGLNAFMGIGSLKLGTQTEVALSAFTSAPVPGTGYSLASEAELGGRATVFTLEKDGRAAVPDTEYTMDPAGLLTFIDRGWFRITMRNSAVHDQGESPLDDASYGDSQATAISSVLDVLPAGSSVLWNGSQADVWLPSSSGSAGKCWLHSGFAVRYLETDDAVFGPDGARDVRIDPTGVRPGGMTVEEDGYVFSGGPIDGRSLSLSAPPGSAVRFSDRASFSSGALVNAGNRLVLDRGLTSTTMPSLEVIGGSRAAAVDSGTGAADFSGMGLSWILPGTAKASDVILQVAGEASLDASTRFRIAFGSGKPDLKPGEAVVLLDAATLTCSVQLPQTVTTPSGEEFSVDIDPRDATRLLATLASTATGQ